MPFPSFTTGEVLTAADMNAVGLWLVKTQTIGSAVSSVTVSSAFSSDYDNYLITIVGGATTVSTAIRLALGSTATGYYQSGQDVTFAGVSTASAFANQSTWPQVCVGTTDSIQGYIMLRSPNLAKRTFMTCSYIFGDPAGGGTGTLYNGYLNNTTQYTAFTLTLASGTATGGTIRVYGYRN
jgi:hypothetical protein